MAALNVAGTPIEELRRLTDKLDTAATGLLVLLELARCGHARSGAGWEQACAIANRVAAIDCHGLGRTVHAPHHGALCG